MGGVDGRREGEGGKGKRKEEEVRRKEGKLRKKEEKKSRGKNFRCLSFKFLICPCPSLILLYHLIPY